MAVASLQDPPSEVANGKLLLPDYVRLIKDFSQGDAQEDSLAYSVGGRLAINYTDESPAADVDTSRMFVPCRIISASTEDRQGDILMADGCDLENYRRNPVVYFDHGHIRGEAPIARAEDPDGNFMVSITDGVIRSGYTFSQTSELAEQTFHLICEGILRAHSVHFNPFDNGIERRGARPPQGSHWPTIFWLWELLEFSVVGIPCHASAVGKMLSDRRLLGKVLHHDLFKSLSKFAPAPAFSGIGVTLPPKLEEPKMSERKPCTLVFDPSEFTPEQAAEWCKTYGFTGEAIKAGEKLLVKQFEHPGGTEELFFQGVKGVTAIVPAVKFAKAMPKLLKMDGTEPGSDTVDASKGMDDTVEGSTKGDPTAPTDTTEGAMKDDPISGEMADVAPEGAIDPNQPLGQQVLQALHANLADMASQITAATAALENPDVQAAVQDVLSQVDALMSQVAGVYSSTYPDGGSLDTAKDDSTEPPPDEADMTAKFFRRSPRVLGEQGLKTVKSVAAALEKVVGDKAVGHTLKMALATELKRLKSVRAVVASSQAEAGKNDEATAKRIKQLQATVALAKRRQQLRS